jgi:hypothetical protein
MTRSLVQYADMQNVDSTMQNMLAVAGEDQIHISGTVPGPESEKYAIQAPIALKTGALPSPQRIINQ